jgi:hypothetical protein
LLLANSQDFIPEITRVIQALVKRSEVESVYFLLEQVKTASQPRITRIIRRSIPFFKPDHQEMLSKALRTSTRQ